MTIINELKGQNPREIAVQVLQQHRNEAFLEQSLEAALAASSVSSLDRHLCQELVYGVVRWRATLDWLIARKTQNRPQKEFLQNLLRLGLYQLFWLDRIPQHAAVNETVRLAREHGFGPQCRFINAVLRGYTREMEPTRAALSELKQTNPDVGYSHPEWLVRRWFERWGPGNTGKLLDWNNRPPPTFARVNLLKADPAKLLVQWREENVDYDFTRHDWHEENLVFELRSHPPLGRLPSFQQGQFYIQDPSTLLAVAQLAPQPGERILDLCAAPGGKLAYIAQKMLNQGELVAHDIAADRLKLVEENCARLGVTCVRTVLPNGLEPGSLVPFDRILLDAPCSNTGVMRRRVGLRWRVRPEELERLRSAQGELLRLAATLLKPGGTLVYSTCSLEPEENAKVVHEFLAAHASFTLIHQRELLPFQDGVDGAYSALLRSADVSAT